jgi:tetratricopeptide (TPR) repeat protein
MWNDLKYFPMRIFIFFIVWLLPITMVHAQVPSKKYQDKDASREKMQQKSNTRPTSTYERLQQYIKKTQHDLDSAKKLHPELGDVQLPDFFNKSASYTSNARDKNDMYASYAPMPPGQNPSHHAAQLPALNTSGIKTLAQDMVKGTKMDASMRSKLDAMAKNSTLNIAGTGTFYLSLGFSPDGAAYLIAQGILQHPDDPYAANGLGVYYRDKDKIKEALQCFFYADKLLPAHLKSPYIYTNIGWASFYYGDYNTAQKYFDKALAISSNFQPALEGQATLAYARGDTKALFQCLAKELLSMTKTAGGGGGMAAVPSSAFTGVCGGAFAEDAARTETESSNSHIFDHIGTGDNSPEQDPPPGADVTYPALFKPVFINDIAEDVSGAVAQVSSSVSEGHRIISSLRDKQKKLDAHFVGRPHADEQGSLVYERDYTKFLNLHGMMIELLESRVDKHIKDFEKFAAGYSQEASARFSDMVQQYNHALTACGNNAGCVENVQCKWIPEFRKEGNNFLETGAEQWEKMYDLVIKDIQWFLRNDADFVGRVHDVKCNEYLNTDREMEARMAILNAYDSWSSVLSPLELYSTYARLPHAKCPTVQMGVMGGPDPFSKRPKHIKEYIDPNEKDIVFPIGILGTITENSHYTKFFIGPKIGPFKLGFTYTTNKDWFNGFNVKDQVYSQNNDFDHSYGVSAGIAYKFGEVIELGSSVSGSVSYNSQGKATGYTGGAEVSGSMDVTPLAKLGGKASRTYQFDSDFNIKGYTNSASGSAVLGGNAPVKKGDPNKASSGFGLNGEYSVTRNYDADGHFTGGGTSAALSLQGSATNSDDANQEMSGENNYFGIQADQVIEVVAGQKQITPWMMAIK